MKSIISFRQINRSIQRYQSSLLINKPQGTNLSAVYLISRSFSVNPQSNDENVSAETPKATGTGSKPISKFKIIADLTKLRLSSLVVFTSGAGYMFAGSPIDITTMTLTCIGTGLCAASASTFNEVFEVPNDAAMKRTKTRPIPSGKITKTEAVAIGSAAGLSGTALLLASSNPTVAMLGAGNILLYSGLYTYSKQKTEWNTWIGSIVGAIPPVMGWCAATNGNLMTPEPYILGSLLFLWQFPHFFALSWLHREDYARGGFQMVPVNDPTGQRTAKLVENYSYYLTAFPILTTALGYTGSMFAVEGTLVNLYLIYLARKFTSDRTNANARKVFLCSLWYLPALLVALVFHSKNWDKEDLLATLDISEKNELKAIMEGRGSAPEDKITEAVLNAKQTLKGICVHEMLTNNTEKTNQAPHLCLKIVSDKAIESTVEMAKDATENITVTASVTPAATGMPTEVLSAASTASSESSARS